MKVFILYLVSRNIFLLPEAILYIVLMRRLRKHRFSCLLCVVLTSVRQHCPVTCKQLFYVLLTFQQLNAALFRSSAVLWIISINLSPIYWLRYLVLLKYHYYALWPWKRKPFWNRIFEDILPWWNLFDLSCASPSPFSFRSTPFSKHSSRKQLRSVLGSSEVMCDVLHQDVRY